MRVPIIRFRDRGPARDLALRLNNLMDESGIRALNPIDPDRRPVRTRPEGGNVRSDFHTANVANGSPRSIVHGDDPRSRTRKHRRQSQRPGLHHPGSESRASHEAACRSIRRHPARRPRAFATADQRIAGTDRRQDREDRPDTATIAAGTLSRGQLDGLAGADRHFIERSRITKSRQFQAATRCCRAS